jgi:hypothetical protein
MKALLGASSWQRGGRAATLLDYFVLPFMRAHPRAAPPDGGRNTIKEETLRHLVREGKLSKAMGLARMCPPRRDRRRRKLRELWRTSSQGGHQRALSDSHARRAADAGLENGGSRLGGRARRRSAQGEVRRTVHGTEGRRSETAVDSAQKAAGVDTTTNVLLRRAFNDGDADTFDTVLYPFASMCLAGTIHAEAMAFLLASRLALVPKVDNDATLTGPGAARQPLDFRPQGIGGSIMRLISTAVCNEDGSAVGHALAPLQLAVRITDGTGIMTAMAQAMFTAGRGGAGGADVPKIPT